MVLRQMAGPSGQAKGWGSTSESSSVTPRPWLGTAGLGDWGASRTPGSSPPEVLGDSRASPSARGGAGRPRKHWCRCPGGCRVPRAAQKLEQAPRGPCGALALCPAPPRGPAALRALPQARPSCLRVARGQGAEGHSLSSGGGQPCPCPCPSPAPHLPLPIPDLLEVLSNVDEMSRRRPEVLGFFSVSGLGVWGAHTPTPAVSFEAGMEKPRGPGPSLRRRGQHVCEPSLLGAPSRWSRDRVTSRLWSLLVLGTSRPQGRGSPGRPATGQRPGGWGPAGPLCSRPRA